MRPSEVARRIIAADLRGLERADFVALAESHSTYRETLVAIRGLSLSVGVESAIALACGALENAQDPAISREGK